MERLKKIGFWGWFSLAVVAIILISVVSGDTKDSKNPSLASGDKAIEVPEPAVARLPDSKVQQCIKNLRAVESAGIIVEWTGNKIRMNPAMFANLKQAEQVGLLNGISCAHYGLNLTDLRGQQVVKIVDSATDKNLFFGSDGGFFKP